MIQLTDKNSKRSTRVRSTRNKSAPPTTQPVVGSVKKKPSKKRFTILISLCMLIGLSLLSYQPIMNHLIGPSQLEKAYVNNLSAEKLQANKERHDKSNDTLFDYESVQTITTLEANPVINTDNVVGGIYVPSVNMTMPIMYGVNHETLLSSAGTMKPNQEMGLGNYALIGHNSKNASALFAPIKRIEQGDMMYITDKERVFAYKMTVKEIVQPSDIHVINDVDGQNILTLLSCTDDGTERVLIQGELVETFNYQDADDDMLKAMNKL